jgi:GNAT superfamily N-acetyltransferase
MALCIIIVIGQEIMIRRCDADDRPKIFEIVNEAATVYEGVIAEDCYHRPYMSLEELEREMARVTFFGWVENGELVGVMGIEPVQDTTLVRHAYILPRWQGRGIGRRLLDHIKKATRTPRLLVGTWAAAGWAISFYRKNGFELLPDKDELLQRYWDIPPRQIETSIVMGAKIDG